jgi:hypothetical protein
VSPNHALLSDVVCVAPGAAVGLDMVAGLPGPERIMLDVGLRRVFASEADAGDESGRHGKHARRSQ